MPRKDVIARQLSGEKPIHVHLSSILYSDEVSLRRKLDFVTRIDLQFVVFLQPARVNVEELNRVSERS
jgi:hypothetical protein